jgi:hypothetical protein
VAGEKFWSEALAFRQIPQNEHEIYVGLRRGVPIPLQQSAKPRCLRRGNQRMLNIGPAQRGVIAALLSLALWLAWQSPSSQVPALPFSEHHHQSDASAATKNKNPNQGLDWNNWTSDPIAVFTAVLTFCNALLFVSNMGLWLQAKRSARIAERALTELEAPFLSIKINAPGLEIKGRNVTFGTLRWCVVNYGRAPATILEICDDTKATRIGTGLPAPIAPKTVSGTPMPYGIIAPPQGQTDDFPFLAVRELIPGTQGDEVPFSEKVLFFIGYVRYSDMLKNIFILGFCFVFDRSGNRWILAGGNEHNYCRKET